MELKEIKNLQHEALWKLARWGVIIFCIIQAFLELLAGSNRVVLWHLFITYGLARWYIKRQIANGKDLKYPILSGLLVSSVVFMIFVAIGIAYLALYPRNEY